MIRFEDATPAPPPGPAPTVRHGVDPEKGVEYLVESWNDGLPWRLQTRPIGADGWEQWSPPVELEEVPEVRP